MFDLVCRAHGIEHRLTKPNHPWTNGQVERMNRAGGRFHGASRPDAFLGLRPPSDGTLAAFRRH